MRACVVASISSCLHGSSQRRVGLTSCSPWVHPRVEARRSTSLMSAGPLIVGSSRFWEQSVDVRKNMTGSSPRDSTTRTPRLMAYDCGSSHACGASTPMERSSPAPFSVHPALRAGLLCLESGVAGPVHPSVQTSTDEDCTPSIFEFGPSPVPRCGARGFVDIDGMISGPGVGSSARARLRTAPAS